MVGPINRNQNQNIDNINKANETQNAENIESPTRKKSASLGKSILKNLGEFFNKISSNFKEFKLNFKAKLASHGNNSPVKAAFNKVHPTKEEIKSIDRNIGEHRKKEVNDLLNKNSHLPISEDKAIKPPDKEVTVKTELSQNAKQLNGLTQEFINTEKTFQLQLDRGIKILEFMKKNNIGSPSSKEFEEFEKKWIATKQISEKFVATLENANSENLHEKLNEDFFEYQNALKECIMNQKTTLPYKNELEAYSKKNKMKYKNFEKQEKLDINPVDSVFITPLQRLTRHALLINGLQKNGGTESQQEAYKAVLDKTSVSLNEVNKAL